MSASRGTLQSIARATCWAVVALAAAPAAAQTPAGISEFLVPFDEDVFAYVTEPVTQGTIGPTDASRATIDVTGWSDTIRVYYDHWENGYGFDIETMTGADEVYEIDLGETLGFRSAVIPRPRTGLDGNTYVGSAGNCTGQLPPKTPISRTTEAENYCYDGRDRFVTVGGAATVTRGGWFETAGGKLAAIGEEVYPLAPQLVRYIVPFGEATTPVDYQRVLVVVQATEDDTTIRLDFDGDGVFDAFNTEDGYRTPRTDPVDATTLVLQRGESYIVDRDSDGMGGTLPRGVTILGDKTLQVEYFNGQTGSNYNTRAVAAYPRGFWGTEYYAPVDGAPGYNTDLLLYNPNTSSITIDWQTTAGSGTFTLAAEESAFFQARTGSYVPDGSAVHLQGSAAFWGISDVDANNSAYDWAYSLVPSYLLKSEQFVSWAPGNDPLLTPPTANARGSGIYVTPVEDGTTFFVDLDGDGFADTTVEVLRGATVLTANASSGYVANRLQSLYITDNDGDMTGARVWATGPFAMAYGENPQRTTEGGGIDLGYTVLPSPGEWMDLALTVDKTTNPVVLSTVAGATSPVVYTLVVDSHEFDLTTLEVRDQLPANWQYLTDTTTVTFPNLTTLSGVAANPTITAGPGGTTYLTWPTSLLGSMQPRQRITIRFHARTTANFPVNFITENRVRATGTRTVGSVTQTFRAADSAFNTYVDTAQYGMTIVKDTLAADPVAPGDVVPYRVTVTNPAANTLTAVTLTDILPAGTTYVDGSGFFTCGGLVARTYLDQFGVAAFGNSNGTADWTGSPWIENEEGGTGATTGQALVTGGALRLRNYGMNLRDEFATVSFASNGPNNTVNWAGDWSEADPLADGAAGGLVSVTANALRFRQAANVRDQFASQSYALNGPGQTADWTTEWIETDTATAAPAGASGGFAWVNGTAGALQLRNLLTALDDFSNGFGTDSTDVGGTADWNAATWTESDSNGAGVGTGFIRTGTNPAGSVALNFDGSTLGASPVGSYIQRTLNLAGATSASLRLDFSYANLETDDDVLVRMSTDGTTFTTIDRLDASDAAGTYTYDISAYASASTVLRFEIASGFRNGDDESYFDNIAITYHGSATAGVASSGTSARRSANLAGASTATLTFTSTATNLEAGDIVVVEASADGASFTTLDTFEGATGAAQARSYDISGYASANTTIRFRVTGGLTINNESFSVDDVDITYSMPPGVAARRSADLSGATAATLSFAYTAANLEAGDTILVEASSNGVDFATVATIDGATGTGTLSYPITAYASDRTAIRYRIAAGFTNADETYTIDNVDIAYTPARPAVWRSANLTGATAATLSFAFNRVNLVAGDTVVIEASADGTTFATLETFTSATTIGTKTYDLLTPVNYASANTTIRLRITNGFNNTARYITADDVQVQYTATGRPAADPPLVVAANAGCSLASGQQLVYTFSVRVDDPFPAQQTEIRNLASVRAAEIPVPLTDDAVNQVVRPAGLTSTVGDLIWLDADGDGAFDVGESGIAGVQVTLKDIWGTPLQVTTTDAQGRYLFAGVPPGSGYYVEVSGGLPGGLTQTTQSRTDHRTNAFDLVAGQDYDLADIGYRASPGTITIGDLVWSDWDGDGMRDAGEPGLGGITVRLLEDTDGNGIGDANPAECFGVVRPGPPYPSCTTVTAPDGSYLFTGVVADGVRDYQVDIDPSQTALGGYTITTAAAFTFSNAPAGVSYYTADFGFRNLTGTYTIRDRVWFDDGIGGGVASDGLQNGTEAGLAGVTVVLLDAASNVIATATTDALGDFQFAGVPGGTGRNYRWQVTDTFGVLNGFFATTASATAGQFQMTGDLTASLDYTTNPTFSPHFGYNVSRAIGDTVFVDSGAGGGTAGNGLQEGAEPGISGVLVQLYLDRNGNGIWEPTGADGPPLASMTTDASGRYLFPGLAPNSRYFVDIPAGQSAIAGYALTTADDLGDSGDQRVVLLGTSSRLDIDYGYQAPAGSSADISGHVWNDVDRDGTDDGAAEPDFAGVSVDLIRNGVVIGSTTTDSAGNYAFVGLPTGNDYTVRITDLNGILTGYLTSYERTTPYDGQETVLNLTANVTDLDFGFFRPTPTHTAISRLAAFSAGGSVAVEWTTSGEAGTLGFHLWRYDPQTGEYRRVNERLLPGLLVHPEGGTYRLLDRGAPAEGPITYALVEVEAAGTETVYGPYTVHVQSRPERDASLRNAEAIDEGFSRRAAMPPAARRAAVAEAAAGARISTGVASLKASRRLKIVTREAGLYAISTADIATWTGWQPAYAARQVRDGFLALDNRGREVPFLPAKDGSALYFYAEAVDSIYSDDNVYWLTPRPAVPMAVTPAAATGALVESFTDTRRWEQDRQPMTGYVSDPDADFWGWEYLFAGLPGYDTRVQSLTVSDVAPGSAGTLTVRFQGASASPAAVDHEVEVSWNGVVVGTAAWDGMQPHTFEVNLPSGSVLEGANALSLRSVLGSGVSSSFVYYDSIDLAYDRLFRARGDELSFAAPAGSQILVSGFTSASVVVLDVTQPELPTLVAGATVEPAGDGTYTVRLASTGYGELRRYHAVVPERARTPLAVSRSISAGLAGSRSRTSPDYLLIAPQPLLAAAETLAAYREEKGLRTEVVALESIYDEFAHGLVSPWAIRSFLRHVSHNWVSGPKHVTLVGRGTWDYKNVRGFADNLVPTPMVATPWGIVASDARLADLDGDSRPDLALGRLPVVTPQQLLDYVAKVRAHEESAPEAWQRRVLLAADDPDAAGNFPADSAQIANMVQVDHEIVSAHLGSGSIAAHRQTVLDALNQGVAVFNYIGHGGLGQLAAENLFTTADVASLGNAGRLPVFLTMTCSAGNFATPGFPSLAETMLLRANGGAYAVWAPSGLSVNEHAVALDTAFFRAAFVGGEKTVGDLTVGTLRGTALPAGLEFMGSIYNLLGEPVARLPEP